MDIKNFIKGHFDFNFYGAAVPAIVCLLLVTPCSLYLPQNYGYENGLLENIQMLILLFTFVICFKVKDNKKFYIFIALLIIILALREINCGRTLFFPIPNKENAFYKWSEIKYGYLAHPLYGIFMLSVAVYFIKNKLYIILWNIISKVKIPAYNCIFLLTGIILSMYADKNIHNLVLEEMAELVMYSSLAGLIFLYAFRTKNN